MLPILSILIEGDDDKRFFSSIVVPIIESNYRKVRIIRYSQDSNEDKKKLLNSFNQMTNVDYIYVTDIDDKKCVIMRKEQVIQELMIL